MGPFFVFVWLHVLFGFGISSDMFFVNVWTPVFLLVILVSILGSLFRVTGSDFSSKLRSENVDFVSVCAIFGGPRPLHVDSRRGFES